MSYQLLQVGKVWHYRFQIGRHREQRSTRERQRRAADAIAAKAYALARLRVRGDEAEPTLSALIERWLAVHEGIASRSHLRAVATLGRLHTYGLGERLIGDLATAPIETARAQHLRGRAPASGNQWLALIKLMINWAIRRGMLERCPFKVKMLKVQKSPRAILPLGATQAWLGAIDAYAAAKGRGYLSSAARLMIGCGLRESEIISARWEWLDWQRRSYTPGLTKGREAVAVLMPVWLAEHLAPARMASGLIVRSSDGLPLRPGFFRAAMAAANLACGTPGITPHRLRGSYATQLSEAGVPVQTIQHLMRHKDIKTTLGYLEINLELVAGAQARIAAQMGIVSKL
jgi:integrase/recombinase XerC